MVEITTIKLSKGTVRKLNNLKIHPRQSYEEVILKLISKSKIQRISILEKSISKAKKEVTTIKISKRTVEKLNRLKIHPRQPYEEVILKLLENEKSKSKK